MSGAHAHTDLFEPGDSVMHRLDPRAKLLAALALILAAVTVPQGAYAAYAALLAVSATWLVLGRLPPRVVVKRLLAAAPFILFVAIFVPFAKRDPYGPAVFLLGLRVPAAGLHALASLLLGALTAIMALVALSATTPMHALTRGMRKLGVPALLTTLIAVTWRYLFLLRDEIRAMRVARDSRGYAGRWFWQAGVIGRMLGSLYLRTLERSERMQSAMNSRGFTGVFPGGALRPLGAADFTFFGLSLAVVVMIRLLLQ
ncbi:MAG: cobalt ECF transporter T component CbiQ [Planctomycetes bacterium]|nr:cobalt ECF transporter T component CbiQ [Planctomycetota bacterium]